MDEHPADELFRRALIDADASAAVALRVTGLPLCEALTVVFHGRRDLGTIQTYVAHGGRGAGSAVAADELLRVPCDLDLAEAEDRDEAEHLYAEQATAMRDALAAADTVLDIWREPLEDVAQARVDRGPPHRPRGPAARAPAAARRAGGARQGHRRHRRLLAPAARGGQAADGDRLRAAGRRPRLPAPGRPRALPGGLPRARRRARTPRRASGSAARSSRCAASSSSPARGSKRPPNLRRLMRRRSTAFYLVAGFGAVRLPRAVVPARARADRIERRAREGARRAGGAGARRRRRGARPAARLPRGARVRPGHRGARRPAAAAGRGPDPQLRAEHAALAHAPHRQRPRGLAGGRRACPSSSACACGARGR